MKHKQPNTSIADKTLQQRIEEGLKDGEEGRVKPWHVVKQRLLKRIASKKSS